MFEADDDALEGYSDNKICRGMLWMLFTLCVPPLFEAGNDRLEG